MSDHRVWIEYERPDSPADEGEVNSYESQRFSFTTESDAIAFMRKLRVMAEDLRFEMDI